MPTLIIAGLVAGVWYAIWKTSGKAPGEAGSTRYLAERLGKATRAGSKAWLASARMRVTLDEARALLSVGEDAPDWEIEFAYRRLMLQAHPDHGGSNSWAAALTAARDRLIKKC